MKKRVIVMAMACFAVLLGVFGGGTVSALNAQGGEAVSLASGQTVDSSFYAAGTNVTIDGTVKGDLYCAGQKVIVTGTIMGDVLCAGEEVRIDGIVEGDIRVAGMNVMIDGTVQGSVTAAGETVALSSSAVVARDLTTYGSTLTIDGTVKRDLLVGSEKVALNGSVGRNVDMSGTSITLGSKAAVGGDLAYTSPQQADITKGAKVAGETTYTKGEYEETQTDPFNVYVVTPLYTLTAFFVIGLLGVLAMPRTFTKTATVLKQRPLLTLGTGLGTLIAAPILAFILMFTIVGLPLGILLLLAWGIALLLGFVVSAYCTGLILTGWMKYAGKGGSVVALLLGLVVLIVLSLIPFIGGFVVFFAIAWGIGGQVLAPLAKDKPAKKKIAKSTKAKTA